MQTQLVPNSEVRKFCNFLAQEKLKFTAERQKILALVLALGSHFQVEDLLVKVRQEGMRVSKATIYRTVPLLIKSGIMRCVFVSNQENYYECVYQREHHDHLICTHCGTVIEFTASAALARLLQKICAANKFKPNKHLLEIEGTCQDCLSSGE